MIGVRADGRKELVALTDGYRESAESWADLLRDCARRGMRAPVLAMGDGALGFWGALREVFPSTREQRCWFHKIANVLGALPKSAHPGAKKALAEIWNAEDKQHALDAVSSFKTAYGAKFGKAVAKITDDLERVVGVLRLPRRALDPPADHQSHRVDLRHRATPHEGHPRPRITHGRTGDGVQAHPGRTRPLASSQRTPSGRTRPCRRDVRQRQARRTTRRNASARSRLKDLHPQVLTIAPGTVISSMHRRHRSVEFHKFLATIDAEVPEHLEVHLICDNYGTHKHPTIPQAGRCIRGSTCTSPRPTPPGSTRSNGSSPSSPATCSSAAITTASKPWSGTSVPWVKAWNDNPKPFVWTKTADQILESLARLLQQKLLAHDTSVLRRKSVAYIGGSRRASARRWSEPRTGRTRPDQQRSRRAAGPSR